MVLQSHYHKSYYQSYKKGHFLSTAGWEAFCSLQPPWYIVFEVVPSRPFPPLQREELFQDFYCIEIFTKSLPNGLQKWAKASPDVSVMTWLRGNFHQWMLDQQLKIQEQKSNCRSPAAIPYHLKAFIISEALWFVWVISRLCHCSIGMNNYWSSFLTWYA